MRLKITAGNLLAVVLLGLACFAVVRYQLRTQVDGEIDTQLGRSTEQLLASRRLATLELVGLTSARAQTSGIIEIFSGIGDARRSRAYDEAQGFADYLASQDHGGRRPDFVAILDDTGHVVARDLDRNALAGEDFRTRYPSVVPALAGTTVHAYWRFQSLLLDVAAVPIRSREGGVLGALVTGFDVGDGAAQLDERHTGLDVAYIIGDKVHSHSLDASLATDLRAYFVEGLGHADVQRTLQSGSTSQAFATTLGGHDFVGVVGAVPDDTSTNTLAYAILIDKTDRMDRAGVANLVLLFTALAAIVVLVYGIILGGVLLRPVEQIEEGILQVINGRTELRLDIKSSEYGGLAYRVNQLLNVMTGVAEESAEEGEREGGAEPP